MSENKKNIILILSSYFVPAYKAGGPIRTLENIVNRVGDSVDFKVICSDRDLGDNQKLSGIKVKQWQQVGSAMVYYCNQRELNPIKLQHLIKSTRFDAYYLNSFWNPYFTINVLLMRKLKLIPFLPVLLAPRGELYSEALQSKAFKKRLVLGLGIWMRLWDSIFWHFSSTQEKENFDRVKPYKIRNSHYILENLSARFAFDESTSYLRKEKGFLKICYVGRIHPHKNLKYLLDLISRLDSGYIELNIYGYIDDENYWNMCKGVIEKLSKNHKIQYHDSVEHSKIFSIFKCHHLSCLPSKSENFGHSIRESIMSGCPVLIGNNTPWQNLEERKIGYNFKLSEVESFLKIIEKFIQLSNLEYQALRENVILGAKIISESDTSKIKSYSKMFYDVIDREK